MVTLNVALRLAREKWPLFPLQGKAAFLPGGFRIATTDEAAITAWLRAFPDANLGIRPPSGGVVLDIDPRDGGASNLVEWLDGRILPPTRTAITGRGDGGMHAWYRMGLDDARKDLVPGVQLKAHETGYVVAPGSRHPNSGRPYRWANGLPVAEAPEWLVEASRKPPEMPRPRPVALLGAPSREVGCRTLTGLVRVVLETQAGGRGVSGRNDALNWASYRAGEHIRDGRLDATQATEALLRAADTVGLPGREAERTVRSGLHQGSR